LLSFAVRAIAYIFLTCVHCAFSESAQKNPCLFEDVTAQSGITFVHQNGAFFRDDGQPSRYMPETMGAGVILFDLEPDGDLDILLLNGGSLEREYASTRSLSKLYRNDGSWRFVDISAESGIAFPFYAMGGSAADFDADGDTDLLISGVHGLKLLRNQGGVFTDVSEDIGLEYPTDTQPFLWATGSIFFDADGDLDLDILAIHYVRWSVHHDIHTTYDGKNKGYTTPKAYLGLPPHLWVQDEGRFYHASDDTGLDYLGKSLGVALWDFNGDNLLDIFVANDTSENFLFHNLGGGKFQNRAIQSGVAFDNHGNTRAGMGVDIADYDNIGKPAIAVGNFSGEPTSFFRKHGPWSFSEDSKDVGIDQSTYPLLTFGLLFADLDLDGWQDIITVNGHVEPNVTDVFPQESYRQPIQWLINQRDGRFIARDGCDTFETPIVGRGLAKGDLDGDGDLDLVVTTNDGPAKILRNNLKNTSYLRVRLVGLAPNTDAIGSRVTLVGQRYTQQRMVVTGGSYLSQSELTKTFGLAQNNAPQRIEILWPNHQRQVLNHIIPNRTMVIKQDRVWDGQKNIELQTDLSPSNKSIF